MAHAVNDARVHLCQWPTGLGGELDLAGGFKVVHQQKRLGNAAAHHQEAVVAQHQVVGLAQVGLQARLFGVVQGHALIGVVAQRSQHKGRLLADGQHAAGLGAHRHPGARVGVQDAACVFARRVHRAVDDKTGPVDRVR